MEIFYILAWKINYFKQLEGFFSMHIKLILIMLLFKCYNQHSLIINNKSSSVIRCLLLSSRHLIIADQHKSVIEFIRQNLPSKQTVMTKYPPTQKLVNIHLSSPSLASSLLVPLWTFCVFSLVVYQCPLCSRFPNTIYLPVLLLKLH